MKAKKIPIEKIELDESIQCRYEMEEWIIDDYAELMEEGAKFPPIVLFESRGKYWIGDGWYRTYAAKKLERGTIGADVRKGGRKDALKHALGANAQHGSRRTNEDKRKAVEIALKELPKLSDRGIANICRVSNTFVSNVRGQVSTIDTSTPRKVTGQDGKSYTVRAKVETPEEEPPPIRAVAKVETPGEEDVPIKYEPSIGLDYADVAIYELSKIDKKDKQRQEAYNKVMKWILEQLPQPPAPKKADKSGDRHTDTRGVVLETNTGYKVCLYCERDINIKKCEIVTIVDMLKEIEHQKDNARKYGIHPGAATALSKVFERLNERRLNDEMEARRKK